MSGMIVGVLLASPHSFEAFPVVGCVLMRGSCVSAEAF